MDKLPLKSKKFIAYLISELGWKILIFYVIWEYKTAIDHYAFMVLISMIITSGFMQVGYVLGQAALDKYAYVAERSISREKETLASLREKIKKDSKDGTS